MQDRNLDSILKSAVLKYQYPGASAAVSFNGFDEFSAFGICVASEELSYDVDTFVRVGCLVKPITAIQIMKLKDDGLLDLDIPVSDIFGPETERMGLDVFNKITCRQLLAHTSGFCQAELFGSNPVDVSNLFDYLCGTPESLLILFPPDSLTSYSSLNYIVLAAVVEKLRGKTWFKDMEDILFYPLGINCYQIPNEGRELVYAPSGEIIGRPDFYPKDTSQYTAKLQSGNGGCLALSAKYLLRIAKMFVRRGVAQSGNRILSEESVNEILRVSSHPSGPMPGVKGFCYGFFKYSDGSIGLGGDGVRNHACMRFSLEEDVALSIVTNYHSATSLFLSVWHQYVGVGVQPKKKSSVGQKESSLELSDIVGEYVSSARVRYIVSIEKDTCYISIEDEGAYLSMKKAGMSHVRANHFRIDDERKFSDVHFYRFLGSEHVNFMWVGVVLCKKV